MDCTSHSEKGFRHRLEWMAGKPKLVSLLASASVLAADECYSLLRVCTGDDAFPVILQPEDAEDWLRLYSDHNRVAQTLFEVFEKCFGALSQGAPADVAQVLIGDGSIAGCVNLLDDKLWRSAFERVEVQFFFQIKMPCVLRFGVDPVELLAKVGRGGPNEWDCIEKLVALDPLIVSHKRITRTLNCRDTKHGKERAVLLGECLRKSLPPISKREVKVLQAAWTSCVSELLGHRFKEPEIRALYDAIAKDREVGLRDNDLPESPEAFSKAIQRGRRVWRLPSRLDNESLNTVRALEALLS